MNKPIWIKIALIVVAVVFILVLGEFGGRLDLFGKFNYWVLEVPAVEAAIRKIPEIVGFRAVDEFAFGETNVRLYLTVKDKGVLTLYTPYSVAFIGEEANSISVVEISDCILDGLDITSVNWGDDDSPIYIKSVAEAVQNYDLLYTTSIERAYCIKRP